MITQSPTMRSRVAPADTIASSCLDHDWKQLQKNYLLTCPTLRTSQLTPKSSNSQVSKWQSLSRSSELDFPLQISTNFQLASSVLENSKTDTGRETHNGPFEVTRLECGQLYYNIFTLDTGETGETGDIYWITFTTSTRVVRGGEGGVCLKSCYYIWPRLISTQCLPLFRSEDNCIIIRPVISWQVTVITPIYCSASLHYQLLQFSWR